MATAWVGLGKCLGRQIVFIVRSFCECEEKELYCKIVLSCLLFMVVKGNNNINSISKMIKTDLNANDFSLFLPQNDRKMTICLVECKKTRKFTAKFQ